MKLSKAWDLYKDLVKGTHRFGREVSDILFSRMEASPNVRRFGGGALDVVAGSGLTYMAGMSILGNVVGTGFAAMSIMSAPIAAIGGLAVGAFWLTLSGFTAAWGLGMLRAAGEKSGLLASDQTPSARVRELDVNLKSGINKAVKFGRGVMNDFSKAVTRRGASNDDQPAAKKDNAPKP